MVGGTKPLLEGGDGDDGGCRGIMSSCGRKVLENTTSPEWGEYELCKGCSEDGEEGAEGENVYSELSHDGLELDL